MKNLLILLAFLSPFTVQCQDTLYDKSGKPQYIKYVEVTSVDNMDKNIVYTGTGWYNGTTTASGFFPSDKPTIAYNSGAGTTAILIFDGTSIEVFCEKKPGHGSAAFQVDSQAPETVPLGVAGPVGSTSVYKRDLPAGRHTFKLTVAGSGNVVFDYVKINGVTVAPPVTPIPPQPPTVRTLLMPGVSMKAVVEAAPKGKEFELGNGNYPENIVNVPEGVSIYPPQSGTATVTMTGTHPDPAGNNGANREIAIFMLKSGGARSTVPQTISGFTILGLNKATGGIYVNNRDNVKILNVKVQDCTFTGFWFRGVANSEVGYCESFNSAGVVSSGWVSGEMNITNVNKVNIHHSKFWNNKVGSNGQSQRGYGIKSLYQDGPFNCHIYNNIIELPGRSPWNNGQAPNISIEFNDATPNGIEINNNTLINCISMACHKPTLGGRIWIHDNDATKMIGSDFFVEVVVSNMTIERNKIGQCPMVTANYNPNGQSNGHWTDIIVDNNDFTSNGANPAWGGLFLLGIGGIDMKITNNRFNNTGGYTRIKHTGPTSASNIVQSGNVPTP